MHAHLVVDRCVGVWWRQGELEGQVKWCLLLFILAALQSFTKSHLFCAENWAKL